MREERKREKIRKKKEMEGSFAKKDYLCKKKGKGEEKGIPREKGSGKEGDLEIEKGEGKGEGEGIGKSKGIPREMGGGRGGFRNREEA